MLGEDETQRLEGRKLRLEGQLREVSVGKMEDRGIKSSRILYGY